MFSNHNVAASWLLDPRSFPWRQPGATRAALVLFLHVRLHIVPYSYLLASSDLADSCRVFFTVAFLVEAWLISLVDLLG